MRIASLRAWRKSTVELLISVRSCALFGICSWTWPSPSVIFTTSTSTSSSLTSVNGNRLLGIYKAIYSSTWLCWVGVTSIVPSLITLRGSGMAGGVGSQQQKTHANMRKNECLRPQTTVIKWVNCDKLTLRILSLSFIKFIIQATKIEAVANFGGLWR